MPSKLLAKLLSLCFSLGFITSCTLTTHDPPPTSTGISIKSLDTAGCLNSAGDTLNDYFEGRASAEKWDGMWDCVTKSFKTFADNTQGQDQNAYTGGELAHFLETYFLAGKTIQTPLVNQAMLLKSAILGGSTVTVSRTEIYQTLELVKILKAETQRLRPYLPIDTDSPRYKDQAKLEEATQMLLSVTENIGKELEKTADTYAFEDLRTLLGEMEIFFNQGKASTSSTGWLRTASEYIDVIKWAKSVFISQPQTRLTKGDWLKLFHLVPRYFSLYLRTTSLFSHTEHFFVPQKLSRLHSIVENVHELLNYSIAHHTNQVISFAELDHLIDEMAKIKDSKFLPVKASVLKDFIRTCFTKILRAPTTLYGENEDGLRLENVDRLVYEFNLWNEGQMYLYGLFTNFGGDDATNGPGITRDQVNQVSDEQALSWTLLKDPNISGVAIRELKTTFAQTRPYYKANENFMSVPENDQNFIYSYNNMIQMNWLKRLSLLLIESYKSYWPSPKEINLAKKKAKDTCSEYDPPIQCGDRALNIEQVEQLFADFFDMLKEFGYLSESGRTMAKSRFFESSLFLSSSNGDHCLDPDEAIELLSSLLSVSSKAKVIWNDIKDNGGCGVSVNPYDNAAIIGIDCVRRNMFENHQKYWSQVPGFSRYLDKFNSSPQLKIAPEQKPAPVKNAIPPAVNDIFSYIYLLARDKDENRQGLDNQHTNLSETQGYVLMPYYVEMIFDRFDKDHSSTINKTESMVAFREVFGKYLKENLTRFGLGATDHNAEAIFTYLLAKGHIPTGCVDKASFYLIWRYKYKNQSYEADRHTIYSIFSALINKLNNSPNSCTPAPSDCELFDWLSKLFGGKKENASLEQQIDANSADYQEFMSRE